MDHKSVLLKTFLSFYADRPIRTFLDGTIGAAGHARALLEAHPEIERLYGLDQDEEALQIAEKNLEPFRDKVRLIHGNFSEMDHLLPTKELDGILLDLGVSSMQLDRPEKGFSFSKEGPLDMRMDLSQPLDAATVVNTFPEKKLGEIFRDYGEEPRWRQAAKALVAARQKKRIQTTSDLADSLKLVLTWGGRGGKKIHPMTLVFQALRIYVNDELTSLEKVLPKAIELLVPGGRLGVISFHSLEDRIVKHTFRQWTVEKKVVITLTKKPLIADMQEIKENPRSRSAKMRFVEKK